MKTLAKLGEQLKNTKYWDDLRENVINLSKFSFSKKCKWTFK